MSAQTWAWASGLGVGVAVAVPCVRRCCCCRRSCRWCRRWRRCACSRCWRGVIAGRSQPPIYRPGPIHTRCLAVPAVPHWVRRNKMCRVIQSSRDWRRFGAASLESRTTATPSRRKCAEWPWTCRWQSYMHYHRCCEHERVFVPGAVMSGLMRLLPSAVTGPRLLKPAIVSVPVFSAPTV